VLGLLVIAGALAIGRPAIGQVDEMLASAASTMQSASRAATTAADAFDGFGASMEQARASATDAARLSRDAAATSAALADAMSVSIFGARPLMGLADEFTATSQQLQGMAVNLDGIGTAISASDADLGRVELSLRSLARDLAELRTGIRTPSEEPLVSLNLLFYAFLLWQALLVVPSLAVGVILLR
jgi:ABC-type transporter Mla subunit MlaD